MLLSLLVAGLATATPVSVRMETDWHAVPYYAHVLETIAAHNSSAYFPLLSMYLSAEETDGKFASDAAAATFLLDTAAQREFIGPAELPLVEAKLANAHRAAHIEALCQHFVTDVVAEFGDEIAACDNVFVYDGKATCDPTDVLALETKKAGRAPRDLLDSDHVIGGAATDVPWAILYADFGSEDFAVFHANLLASALQQKVSYVLRYKPSRGANPSAQIGGYGVTVQLKRTDYLVVNDRQADGEQAPDLQLDVDANKVDEAVVPTLGQRAASYIVDAADPFAALVDVSLNFPSRIADFKETPVSRELLKDADDNDAADFYSPGTNVVLTNGRPVFAQERNVYQLLDVLSSEQRHVAGLEELGLDTETAKTLLTSGVVLGADSSNATFNEPLRYNLASDAVMWLNDIETDPRFAKWKRAARILLADSPLGQFAPIRRNINSLVLAVDFGNASWLQMLGQLLQILRRGAPVQVGVVPVTSAPAAQEFVELATESSSLLARQMYIAGLLKGLSPQDARREALETPAPDADQTPLLTSSQVWQEVAKWARQFEITQSAVFANGVRVALSQAWLVEATNQFSLDARVVRQWVEDGQIAETDLSTNLRDRLLATGLSTRSDVVDPLNPAGVIYVDPSAALATTPLDGAPFWTIANTTQTVWVVADFSTPSAYRQLSQVLDLAGTAKTFSVGVLPVLMAAPDERYARAYAALVQLSRLPALAAINSIEAVGEWHVGLGAQPKVVPATADEAVLTLAAQAAQTHIFADVVPRSVNLVVDGRLVVLPDVLSDELVTLLLQLERPRAERLAAVAAEYDVPAEPLITRLTQAWHGGENARLVSTKWFGHARAVKHTVAGAKVDITAIVDPASEIGQELIAYLKLVADLDVASINVLLSPRQLKVGEVLNRHYQGVFPAKPAFDAQGRLAPAAATFDDLKDDVLYVVGVDEPAAWVVAAKDSDYDLDNVVLNTVAGRLDAAYELKALLLEGHASDVTARQAPRGVQLRLATEASVLTDTMVMANLGYFQLQSPPGFYRIDLAEGPSRDIFQFGGDGVSSDSISLWITEMDGTTIMPSLVRRKGQESADVLASKKKSWFSKTPKPTGADINIFTVASGHLYERFLSIMTLSVMAHTDKTVKFWLIENFLSPSFKHFLPTLASEYGFEYELVTYKWPKWLRGQSEKQREIWGCKILFLDVLFPQNLSKVIFVDSDQIVRTDMMELVNEDLGGAPYGFTPMGDDREEMEGFRFWKQGYWENFLQGAPYHISALYVVDLDRFREMGAGDILRHHYQQLSADPQSLSNLDQDLPNNLQFVVPIHSLDKDWLWCETWCADEGLATAKTIDLCNNPLTKEPKLDRARRQIPEWVEYDDAVAALRKRAADDAKQRAAAAEASAEAAARAAVDVADDRDDEHDEL